MRSRLQSFDRVRDGRECGHQNDLHVRIERLDLLEQAEPVHPRHLYVADDDIDALTGEQLQRFDAVRGREELELVPNDTPEERMKIELVVDDEEARLCH